MLDELKIQLESRQDFQFLQGELRKYLAAEEIAGVTDEQSDKVEK